MNRSQAKELLPIMQAFVEGETIEVRSNSKYNPGEWIETTTPSFDIESHEYRIKPKPKYRPFKDTEECWQEMLKHQPFGWIKDKEDGYKVLITKVNDDENTDNMSINGNGGWTLEGIMGYYTFADGTPFGIKVG